MTRREVVIDGAGHAALLVDGRLEDLLMEAGDTLPRPGEIHWAKLDRIAPSAGGAFLRLGGGYQGYMREIKGLKQGQGLLVQVSGYAEPGKAIPVSRRLLHKSRQVILTPGAPGINVSRRIREGGERTRLTGICEGLVGAETGLILRSAAAGASEADLTAAVAEVAARAAAAQALSQGTPPAAGPQVTAAEEAMREWEGRLTQTPDAFEAHGIWEQIQELKEPETPLPSGGSMVVEATRALVAVDVNTGANFSPGAAMTANVEAARELPRQLRLRGLGGQITVDVAPIKKMHRKKLEEELRRAFRNCPVETSMAGWTPLGHMELQRKRERRPLTL
ncbi:MAG: ribonuclease E/G [Pseudomonadota bacterium]